MKTTPSFSPALVVTVDVEDWPQSTWDRSLHITDRAARNTELVLDLLASHGKTGTMFVLGKFAERFPQIVKRIASEGHEVASHGFGHVEVFCQSPSEFREDVRRSKDLLEGIVGRPVAGYRAPDFSIVPSSFWALSVLADLGFTYDSSIFPVRHSRYGIVDWPTLPVRVCLSSGQSIVELPMATVTVFGRRFPVAGGGYHRLLPSSVIRWAISRRFRSGGPFVSYCHPYEFDPNEFKESDLKIPLSTRLHQGLGRCGFRAKFERMLSTFDVQKASQIVDLVWPEYTPKNLLN